MERDGANEQQGGEQGADLHMTECLRIEQCEVGRWYS
jgi:hypothetical protein